MWARSLAAIRELDYASSANGILSMSENPPKHLGTWHEFYVLA